MKLYLNRCSIDYCTR